MQNSYDVRTVKNALYTLLGSLITVLRRLNFVLRGAFLWMCKFGGISVERFEVRLGGLPRLLAVPHKDAVEAAVTHVPCTQED